VKHVSGLADVVKPLVDHLSSACVKVVSEHVERKCLELRVENVDDAISEYNVPEKEAKQRPNSCTFPV